MFYKHKILAPFIDDRAPLRAVTQTMVGCQESMGLENATCSSRTTSGSLIIINLMLGECDMITVLPYFSQCGGDFYYGMDWFDALACCYLQV